MWPQRDLNPCYRLERLVAMSWLTPWNTVIWHRSRDFVSRHLSTFLDVYRYRAPHTRPKSDHFRNYEPARRGPTLPLRAFFLHLYSPRTASGHCLSSVTHQAWA
jgi:hypothetical protein